MLKYNYLKQNKMSFNNLGLSPFHAPRDPNSRTHRGCEEGLSIHSQHWLEVPEGGQGLPHQREVEAEDNGGHRVVYTILRDSGGLGVCLLSFPSPPHAWRTQSVATSCSPVTVASASHIPDSA